MVGEPSLLSVYPSSLAETSSLSCPPSLHIFPHDTRALLFQTHSVSALIHPTSPCFHLSPLLPLACPHPKPSLLPSLPPTFLCRPRGVLVSALARPG